MGTRTRANMPGERSRLGLGIGKRPRICNVPVIWSTRVVDEVDRPLVRIAVLVGQPQEDRQLGLLGRLDLAGAEQATEPQHAPLVYVEIGVYRVERDDGGEDGVVGLDEVARVDPLPADPAADRGGDDAPVEVELGGVQGRLGHLDRRGALVVVALGQVEVRLG